MRLFSKRNKPSTELQTRDRYFDTNRSRIPTRIIKRRQELLSEEARNRIVSQIHFVSHGKDFLESYILADDRNDKTICLNSNLLDNFSLAELGYKFSVYFKYRKGFQFIGSQVSDDEEQSVVTIYDDYKLFDLIETIILFAKEGCREDLILRINKIFQEEKINWKIIRHLITKDTGENLSDMINQLKDPKLVSKLKAFYDFYENEDYINSAKVSADILNIIFSDFLQGNKKTKIEQIKNNIVDLVVVNEKEIDQKKKEMKDYLQELLVSSKNLNNNIFDIRHSEKSTIKISNPFIYKLISNNNISLVEFVLTSLKDEFILTETWEAIKTEYLEKYKIDKNTNYYYEEDKEDFSDIPF